MRYRDQVMCEIAERVTLSDLRASELAAVTDYVMDLLENGSRISQALATINTYAGRIKELEAEKRTRDESGDEAIHQLEYEAGIRDQELADLRIRAGRAEARLEAAYAAVPEWLGTERVVGYDPVHGEHSGKVKEHITCRAVKAATETLQAEVNRLRGVLYTIANDPHCIYPSDRNDYSTGVADGHRCAAQKARDALSVSQASEGKVKP